MPPLTTRVSLLLALCVLHVHAAFPRVDFDRMGKVGLAGAFAGLDFFSNSSVAFDPATSTLFSRSSDGSLTRLASTNSGGTINAACELDNVVYFAGSFASLAGTDANNIASYNPSSNTFSSLTSNSPNGEIRSLFCDQQDNKVWVGGSFTSPGSSLAIWDAKAQSWSPPPFKGFSSAQSRVDSITTNSSGSSIFFAGSFVTAFGTALNATHNPGVPFSAGATPFSSSLVPVPLESAEVDGSPSTDDSGFTNIQNVLCPSGPDGPGNSWFAIDNGIPLITIRAFSFISASGVRLGNTFQPDHGTTGFSVTSIPDNQVLTMTYIDPATGQNQTCSDPCPLSTDSSLLYQDFLFDKTLSITGVQIKLSGFTGHSPGLHLLQLLSSGAFASAVEQNNGQSCFAPNPSNTTRTGDWVAKVSSNTGIAGTTQTVLVSDVSVDTSPASGPSFTWIPYVSAAGNYDVSLLIPGCNEFLDCAARTSVKVTLFPGEGLPPSVTTIKQTNTENAEVLLYSGPIVPSGPNFVTTITMTLADQPDGSGSNGKYEIVADRVQLVLKSVSFSTSNSSTGLQGLQRGFGFFEWPRSLGTNNANLDASQILPNSSLTALDAIGIQMNSAIGNSSQLNAANITAVAHHPSGIIFLGGSFRLSSGSATGASNIVMFKDGALISIAGDGLNGPVSALLIDQDRLYVGGAFDDTASGSTNGNLRSVTAYEIVRNTWTALGAGVNGPVTGLSSANGFVQAVGSFSSAGVIDVSGIAVWNNASSVWTSSGGFVVGGISFIANGTEEQWLAGNVASFRKFGASGIAMLENGDANGPKVDPVQVAFSAGHTSSNTTTSNDRRSYAARSAWLPHALSFHQLSKRQSPVRPNATLPLLPSSPAPAVLAGAFWTNTSTSREVTILGGNFTYTVQGGNLVSGVVAYDPTTGLASGLAGPQITGAVHSLLVDGSRLYVGGQFTIPETNASGLAIYDLSKNQWDLANLQPLQSGDSGLPIVRSVSKSTLQPNRIIAAGAFSQAGSLHCEAVCIYDTSSSQWNTPGVGVSGQVAAVAYAGDNEEVLFVGGSLTVGDSTSTSVARFDLANSTWTGLDSGSGLPGPVTAIEVNNGNASSIFAAGRTSDGSTAFLSFWNGADWSTLGSNMDIDTTVSQLVMVPLQDTHVAQGVIQPDRMLMMSGTLVDSSFGNASSVLFDGQAFIPYVVSTTASGQPGFVASVFHSFAKFSFAQHKFLATGIVILISIAIAAGVVFLLALIGIIWTLFSRRDDKVKYEGGEEDDDSTQHRPSSLLEHINAATRSTILGATSPFSDFNGEKEEAIRDANQDPFGPDASNYLRAETPSEAAGGLLPEESSRIAHVRYDFVPDGEGELPLQAGAEVEILDDKDHAWWYARDLRTGREGIVPAAYLY